MSKAANILLLSDFNVQNFAAALKKTIPGSVIHSIPYNQLYPVVMDTGHEVWQTQYDLVICWAFPAAIAPSFPAETATEETRKFISLLKKATPATHRIFIECMPDAKRFHGFAEQEGMLRLHEMNVEIYKEFSGSGDAVISPLSRMNGREAYSPKLWYLSKTPFHKDVFLQAAAEIRSYWDGWNGRSKKLLIVDLDDTLWGGIVGDDGWQNLRLGGHDGEGEAYADFQREIKRLKEKGIILAIVSKNDEPVAMEAIRKHPEMILQESDFAAWKINWNDKAENIALLVRELNLGLDSAVFLDDNPIERERVKAALPVVTVPDLPHDVLLYPQFLAGLSLFNTPALTQEDKDRSALYRQEKERKEEQEQFMDMDSWLASLGITLEIEALNRENLPRAAQLLNKTNQMNLRTRRMSEEELWSWSQQPQNELYTVKISDKIGNAGLTGIAGFSIQNGNSVVEDFVLSCRVMGRKVEEAMLGFIIRKSREKGAEKLIAGLIPTEKNNPCKSFFDNLNLQKDNLIYSFLLEEEYKLPEYITIRS